MKITKITNEKYDEKMFLVIILGVLEAVINKKITINEINSILPVGMHKKYKFNKKINDLLIECHYIEDFESLLPNELESQLHELKEQTLLLLSEYNEYSNVRWLTIGIQDGF